MQQSAVGNFVERMAPGVIELKDALCAKRRKAVLERGGQPIVVRNTRAGDEVNPSKAGVESSCWQTREIGKSAIVEGIDAVILHQLVNAMVAHVTDRNRTVRPKALLNLQAPFLILRIAVLGVESG